MISLQWTDVPEIWDNPDEIQKLQLSLPSEPSSLFIEGDNYPALQKLVPSYKEKIHFIYIDPPYNTGNTFTYKDTFTTDDNKMQLLALLK